MKHVMQEKRVSDASGCLDVVKNSMFEGIVLERVVMNAPGDTFC